jgi:hypothetical protein
MNLPETLSDHDDAPWLRDTLADDLVGLCSESKHTVQMAVRDLVDRIPHDRALENLLIETLETAVTEQNDDSEASIWLALIIAETGAAQGIPALLLALEHGEEELQHVARLALLKLGTPAVANLLAILEDDLPSEALLRASCDLLGNVGFCGDEALTARVIDLLRGKLEDVFVASLPADIIEHCSLALSRLGDREALTLIVRVQKEHFEAENVVLKDVIEWLEEQTPGTMILGERIPGEEDYEWAFQYAPDAANKPPATDDESSEDRTARDHDEADNLYRGLGTPIEEVDGYWDDASQN